MVFQTRNTGTFRIRNFYNNSLGTQYGTGTYNVLASCFGSALTTWGSGSALTTWWSGSALTTWGSGSSLFLWMLQVNVTKVFSEVNKYFFSHFRHIRLDIFNQSTKFIAVINICTNFGSFSPSGCGASLKGKYHEIVVEMRPWNSILGLY
jgi:hypothetical protein